MTSPICVDSGMLLKLLLHEPDSDLAEALWHSWIVNEMKPIAPQLLPFEVTAVLRKITYRGLLDPALAQAMLRKGLDFDIKYLTFPGIHKRAWVLATKMNRPTAFDTHYLALAEHVNGAFWTADKRLYNAARVHFPWVQWLGNFDRRPTL